MSQLKPLDMMRELLGTIEISEEMFSPQEAGCADHDKLIGVVEDPFLRKLYGCAQLHRRDQKRMQLEAGFESNPEAKAALVSTALQSSYRADWCMETFWLLTRLHFNHWVPVRRIGLRKGWQFVERTCEDNLEQVLRRAMGGE